MTDDLHRLADKVDHSMTHLEQAMRADHVDLALAAAKRVRRDATLLVRALAECRDTATTQEGTSA